MNDLKDYLSTETLESVENKIKQIAADFEYLKSFPKKIRKKIKKKLIHKFNFNINDKVIGYSHYPSNSHFIIIDKIKLTYDNDKFRLIATGRPLNNHGELLKEKTMTTCGNYITHNIEPKTVYINKHMSFFKFKNSYEPQVFS